jgi:hypothetical protein
MKKLIFIILMVALVSCTSAVPAVPTVTGVTNNAFTATAAGHVGTLWFAWGRNSANPEWVTPNTTTDHWTVKGSPIMPGYTYYVKSCDATGCSATATFTTLAATPITQTTYGNALNNVTENNFDIMMVINQIPTPYLWAVPTAWTSNGMGIALCAGLLFGFYFLGLWFRQRKVTGPIILGLIVLAFILTPQTGLNFGMPPEIAMLAQMGTYAALAGVILTLFKK